MFWFDPIKGYNRELRYATNQKSVFVDEQEGPVTLEHIVFEDGTLYVPKEVHKKTLYYCFYANCLKIHSAKDTNKSVSLNSVNFNMSLYAQNNPLSPKQWPFWLETHDQI